MLAVDPLPDGMERAAQAVGEDRGVARRRGSRGATDDHACGSDTSTIQDVGEDRSAELAEYIYDNEEEDEDECDEAANHFPLDEDFEVDHHDRRAAALRVCAATERLSQ